MKLIHVAPIQPERFLDLYHISSRRDFLLPGGNLTPKARIDLQTSKQSMRRLGNQQLSRNMQSGKEKAKSVIDVFQLRRDQFSGIVSVRVSLC